MIYWDCRFLDDFAMVCEWFNTEFDCSGCKFYQPEFIDMDGDL